MKKYIFSSLALVAMMFAGTSCSSEEVAPVTGESTVTLSVTLPDGIQSRTFGDGATAQKLTMLVLDQNDKALSVFNGDAVLNTDINLTKQVNLQLASGKTYKVVCWAAAEGAPYTFNTTDFTVSANYDGAKTSDEALDAFYAVQDITVKGNTTETVKLYRPFAQLNIGTDDLAAAKAAGFEAESVTVTVPTYKSLNLLTGAVEQGDPTAVTFAANALPTGEAFPKTGYDYLSMNYLLMSADKQLVDVEFTVKAKDGATRTLPVNAVPVQRNYRTNIYGSLLTNSVNINVEIVPAFNEPGYEYDALAISDALSAGKNVILYGNLTAGNVIKAKVPAGQNAILNLNGYTINNTEDFWNEPAGEWSLVSVQGGTLTVTGNGTLKAKADDCFAFDVQNGGHLIIENGTFIGNLEAVYVTEGTAEIKGGFFDIQQKDTGSNPYGFMLNCLDENYKNGKAKIIVSGGTFVGYDPANSSSENPKANFVAPGYKSVKTTVNGKDAWTVVPQDAVKTIEELLDAAKADNAVVTVAPNTEIVLSGSKLGKNVTIIGSEGSVIKQEGEFNGDKFVFVYDTEGLTLKNITVDCGNANYKSFARCNDMKFDNCTIKGQLCLNGDGITFENCKFVQTDKNMYNLWSYAGNNVIFNKCVFENVGKAINVYREGPANVFLKQTFNNCEFKSNPVNKAALNIKTDNSQCWELVVNNCTLSNGMKVYQIDNAGNAANQIKLTIDGTQVTF